MRNINDIIALIDRAQARIELEPMKARYGFELAERLLDEKLLGYGTTRYNFKNCITKLYLPLYQQIIDGYQTITENLK